MKPETRGQLKLLNKLEMKSNFFYRKMLDGEYHIFEGVTIVSSTSHREYYYKTPDEEIAKAYVKGLNET